MFALLKDVPVVNHPVLRIVLGGALVAVGLLVFHRNIIVIAVGALLLVMGIVRGVSALAGHTHRRQPQ
jgi:uncharacterized membrane protein HdeD (DUF308 family)